MSYGRPRNSGYGGFPSTKPVEEGKEYDVTITETSRRGDGVAKLQGFVIFVTGGTVGQKVKIKVDRVSNRFASATVISGEGSSEESSTPAATESSEESSTPAATESSEESSTTETQSDEPKSQAE